jgi:prepilin-type N-terminal cleavage/methylation domain-containing protein
MRSQNKSKRSQGFSLVEILVAVAIMALLSAIAIPIVMGQKDKAVVTSMVSDGRTGFNELSAAFTGYTTLGTVAAAISQPNYSDVLGVATLTGANPVATGPGGIPSSPLSENNSISGSIMPNYNGLTMRFCISVTNSNIKFAPVIYTEKGYQEDMNFCSGGVAGMSYMARQKVLVADKRAASQLGTTQHASKTDRRFIMQEKVHRPTHAGVFTTLREKRRLWGNKEAGMSEIAAALFVVPFIAFLIFALIEAGFNMRMRTIVDNATSDTVRSIAQDGGLYWARTSPLGVVTPDRTWETIGQEDLAKICETSGRCDPNTPPTMTCTVDDSVSIDGYAVQVARTAGATVSCVATLTYNPVSPLSSNEVTSVGFSKFFESKISSTVIGRTVVGCSTGDTSGTGCS